MPKAKFHCYSPGASPLVFCFMDENDHVLSERTHPVYPSRVLRWLKAKGNETYRDYTIHKLESRWTVLAPITRIDDETVMYNGTRYRYRHLRDIPADRELWMNDIRIEYQPYHGEGFEDCETDDRDQWWQVKNWSIRHSIAWFIRYENIREQSQYKPGHITTNEMSWGYRREFKTTIFDGGDGRTLED